MTRSATTLRTAVRAACVGLAACLVAAPTGAQLAPDLQTTVVMSVIAERGGRCGVLAGWEAAVLRAEARRIRERFEPAERRLLLAEAVQRAAGVACDDPSMRAWVEAVRERIELEFLPKFLAAYRGLAVMDDRPEVFAAATGRVDYGPAVRAVDAQFATLEVAGVDAPGGAGWFDYADRIGVAIAARVDLLATGEGDRDAPGAAAVHIVESALIVELWLDAVLGPEP